MKAPSRFLLMVLFLALASLACEAADDVAYSSTATNAVVTPIPPYVSTDQAAGLEARSTIQAGQAEISNLQVTGTAVAMDVNLRGTQIALDLAVSAETEQALVRQTQAQMTATEAARAQTATAGAEATQATQNALHAQETTQAGTATAVAQGTENAVRAAETQARLAIVQAGAQAEVERIAEERRAEQQTLLWRTWSMKLFWGSLAVLCLIGTALLVWTAYKFRMAIYARLGLIRWGRDGKPYLPVPLPGGGLAMLDMTKSAGPVITVLPSGQADMHGLMPPEIQAAGWARSQAAEMLLAAPRPPRPASQPGLLRPVQDGTNVPQIGDGAGLPALANWQIMEKWGSKTIPLGMGRAGMIHLDPYGVAPHLLMAGTTGSGKTFHGMRPVVGMALAQGRQAVILARSGPGMGVFKAHPNTVYVRLEQPEDAARYLHSIYLEIVRRNRILEERGAYAWEQLHEGAPQLLVVMDEFSNLADEMDKAGQEELWRWTRMIGAEGRKAGILLALALQDPTHKSIDLRIRRNCTRVAFRVQDAEASRVILGANGAETLDPESHQFLATVNGLARGVAFGPQDGEIEALLNARPVQSWAAPAWLGDAPEATQAPAVSRETISLAENIRQDWLEGASKRAMARGVGREYAGAFAAQLDKAIEYLEMTATTTTETPLQGATPA